MTAMLALKRRRELKTDYRLRLGLIKSSSPRIVVRRSLRGFRLQAIAYEEKGDRTIFEITSDQLKKYGWKAHAGSVPAAYLTGLLFGKLALKSGVKTGVLDTGLQRSVTGSSIFAAAKGCADAGIALPLGEEAAPSEDRIKGVHIAEYAKKLKGSERYRQQFSLCIRNGLEPEKIAEHFEEVKTKIEAV